MGNKNVKKVKCATEESLDPKPPTGMPNPMEYDLQDIEPPDDVFIKTNNR